VRKRKNGRYFVVFAEYSCIALMGEVGVLSIYAVKMEPGVGGGELDSLGQLVVHLMSSHPLNLKGCLWD
jgi:hypothetical protein